MLNRRGAALGGMTLSLLAVNSSIQGGRKWRKYDVSMSGWRESFHGPYEWVSGRERPDRHPIGGRLVSMELSRGPGGYEMPLWSS